LLDKWEDQKQQAENNQDKKIEYDFIYFNCQSLVMKLKTGQRISPEVVAGGNFPFKKIVAVLGVAIGVCLGLKFPKIIPSLTGPEFVSLGTFIRQIYHCLGGGLHPAYFPIVIKFVGTGFIIAAALTGATIFVSWSVLKNARL